MVCVSPGTLLLFSCVGFTIFFGVSQLTLDIDVETPIHHQIFYELVLRDLLYFSIFFFLAVPVIFVDVGCTVNLYPIYYFILFFTSILLITKILGGLLITRNLTTFS